MKSRTLTDTQVSALEVARAALRTPTVHGPHPAPISCLVAGPEMQTRTQTFKRKHEHQ